MISIFKSWLLIGIEHITDLNGNDHMLFLLALCCSYGLANWKKLLIIISAFTIGHCITLALSVTHFITINSNLVEFLIPITIIITCVVNLLHLYFKICYNIVYNYALTICFGLIHGLGFSTLLKQILGKEDSIIFPLFSFNIGIEIGQIFIVFLAVWVQRFFMQLFNLKLQYFTFIVSIIIFIIAMQMAFNRAFILLN
ncbi:MAG: HupE/UreJ family protein [Candidatus Methylacidiphilales bacterium]